MEQRISETEKEIALPVKPAFPNLDALRFWAFLGVFFGHLFQPHANWGLLGVNLFFVLSAFLITTLLLEEKKQQGEFSIPKFYLRRILRIWPLYFLMIGIGFFLIPLAYSATEFAYHETADIRYFLFFGVNFHLLYLGFPYSPMLAVLWTISVEEQFYLSWPWLMKVGKKILPLLCLIIIGGSLIFRIMNLHAGRENYFNTLSVMSDFGVGALFAWIASERGKIFDWLSNLPRKFIFVFYLLLLAALVFYDEWTSLLAGQIAERLVMGLLFGFLVFEQCFCNNSPWKAGINRRINYFGKISYGLYCFHELGILLSLHFFFRIMHSTMEPLTYLFLQPLLGLGITVALAALSYEFFEKWFLRWKEKFNSLK